MPVKAESNSCEACLLSVYLVLSDPFWIRLLDVSKLIIDRLYFQIGYIPTPSRHRTLPSTTRSCSLWPRLRQRSFGATFDLFCFVQATVWIRALAHCIHNTILRHWTASICILFHPHRLRGPSNEIVRRSKLRSICLRSILPFGVDSLAYRFGVLPSNETGKWFLL